MAHDQQFAARLEAIIHTHLASVSFLSRTRMFGGIGFLLEGKMCIHVFRDMFILRVGEEFAKELIADTPFTPWSPRDKPMKGWIMVDTAEDISDKEIAEYCKKAINYVQTLPVKIAKPRKKRQAK